MDCWLIDEAPIRIQGRWMTLGEAQQRLAELRQRLWDSSRDLRDGKITPRAANVISRDAGRELAAIQREMLGLARKRKAPIGTLTTRRRCGLDGVIGNGR